MYSEITVLTATIPERIDMLKECIESVANQTLKPVTHNIIVDVNKRGNHFTYNDLLSTVKTKWLCFLDDDDVFYPDHLEKLVKNSEGYDIVFANADVNDPLNIIRYNDNNFDPKQLAVESVVPITALVKTAAVLDVGGFEPVQSCDYKLWRSLYFAGYKFNKINDVTWRYRFHDTNFSRKGITWN